MICEILEYTQKSSDEQTSHDSFFFFFPNLKAKKKNEFQCARVVKIRCY